MNVKKCLALAVLCVVSSLSTVELSAQDLNDDNQLARKSRRAKIRHQMRHREDFNSPSFLNKYHPDWPALGIPLSELGSREVPYLRTHRRAYADSLEFRPWFHRRRPFSRRERWPYRMSRMSSN